MSAITSWNRRNTDSVFCQFSDQIMNKHVCKISQRFQSACIAWLGNFSQFLATFPYKMLSNYIVCNFNNTLLINVSDIRQARRNAGNKNKVKIMLCKLPCFIIPSLARDL